MEEATRLSVGIAVCSPYYTTHRLCELARVTTGDELAAFATTVNANVRDVRAWLQMRGLHLRQQRYMLRLQLLT